jgi:phage protein D
MTGDPGSVGTQPRGAAYANGERLVGVISFDVDVNTFYQADTFRLNLALSQQPPGRGWAWWGQQMDIEVELMAGYPQDPAQFAREDLVTLLIGNVDDIEIDPIADTIVMSGRDLTSLFIDNKTSEKYQNLTASQVAEKLAAARGLTPVVVSTQEPVGTYYQLDHVSMQDNRPEWDLLTYLANMSGNVVYIKGRELHFEPKPGADEKVITPAPVDKEALRRELDQLQTEWAAELNKAQSYNVAAQGDLNRIKAAQQIGSNEGEDNARAAGEANLAMARSTQEAARAKYAQREKDLKAAIAKPDAAPYIATNAYVLRWQPPTPTQASPVFNGMTLNFRRNLTVAKDIKVTVRSWNQKQKKGFTVTANRVKVKNATTGRIARSALPPQQYTYFFPNMTPEEAQRKANQLLKDISEHEMNMMASIPGDQSVGQATVFRVEGTGTAFDQLYYPASVVHSYSEGGGYRTSITAKNSSPESTVMP